MENLTNQLKSLASGDAASENMLSETLKKFNDEAKKSAGPRKPVGKDEVNFDDISSSSEESKDGADKDSDFEDDEIIKLSVDEYMTIIVESKELGNKSFLKNTDADNKEALKQYNKGLSNIEKVEDEKEVKQKPELNDKLENLRISLWLNKAAVCNRLGEYKYSRTACTEVLGRSPAYVKKPHKIKALLRRGQAQMSTGNLTDAKNDFLSVYELDQKNKEAVKKLKELKKIFQEQKERYKKQYANFLEKKSMDLYGDQVDEKVQERREYERYKGAHQRVMGGQNMLSFDAWKKQTKEEKKERDSKLLKAETAKARREKGLDRKGNRKEKEEEIYQEKEVELDEADLKAIKEVKAQGYYNSTRKGVKQDDIKPTVTGPTKIDGTISTPVEEELGRTESVQSSWNKGQTWEEKDIKEGAKTELSKSLTSLSVAIGTDNRSFLKFDKVSQFSGEVHRVFVSGKEGAVYDVGVEIKFKGSVYVADEEKKVSGKVKYEDVANGVRILDEKELEAKISYSSAINKLDEDKAQRTAFIQAARTLETKIRAALHQILEGKYVK
eukprot:snap_masked-scaffold_6-processed-gene-19.1-mRNA-1 protein AED:1.00 eAED:1.00 QI:0/-1/0/0/-1/1/1/0/554